MLSFAVAAGPAIPAEVLDALGDPHPSDLPFRATRHLRWSNPSGTVVFAGWQDDVELGMGDRCHERDGGLTAFTGSVWPRAGVWPGRAPWAEQLAGHLRGRPTEDAVEDLLGIHTLVSIQADGDGVVTSDQLGTSVLYRAETGGTTILSSRARLAARLAHQGSPPRDVVGAGWLAYCGQPFGRRTGFVGVEVVPLGVRARLAPTGVTFETGRVPWRSPLTGDRETLVDGVYSDIVATIRAALALPVERRVVELTGGRDSRLILAVLLAEGLADQFEYRTFGEPDLPDVRVAQQLAAKFGLRHERGHDPERQQRAARRRDRLTEAHPGVPLRELQLRANVGDWSCSRNAWEVETAAAPAGDRVALNGLYGETLSTNYPTLPPLRTHSDLRAVLLSRMKHGAAGILEPDAMAGYREDLMAAAYDGFSQQDSPYDVIDAAYLRDRLPRWFGTTQEADQLARMCPLHSPTGVRLGFTLGPSDRHWSWTYRELYRRAWPELAEMPFTSTAWPSARVPVQHREPTRPPRIRWTSDRRSAVKVRLRGPLPGNTAAAAAARRASEAVDIQIMRQYLVEDPSNPVFEVLDRSAVARALARFDRLGELSKKQLYGALTAAVWLGGHEITMPPS